VDPEKSFDQLPANVRTMRFRDSSVSWKVRGTRKDLFLRNVNSNLHFHVYVDEDKVGMVITNEHRRGTHSEHSADVLAEFMQFIAKLCNETLSVVEPLDPADPKYLNKKVVLATVLSFDFLTIRRRMAYFDIKAEFVKCKFSEIHTSPPQIGAIKGWFGQELALLIVGSGMIHCLSITKMKRIANRMAKELHQIIKV
jgi:hypothetical protein